MTRRSWFAAPADAILISWGWRRALIGIGAGALSALALPPLGFFPVLWLTLPVLVLTMFAQRQIIAGLTAGAVK